MTALAVERLYLADTGERPVSLITESGGGASECSGTCRPQHTPIGGARHAGALPRESIEVRVTAFW